MENVEITAQEAMKLYQREWRSKNKDKVKKYNQRYWENKAEKLRKERENNV